MWSITLVATLIVAYLIWDAIDTKKANSKFITQSQFVYIRILNDKGKTIDQVDYKTFGFNSIGLSEALAKPSLQITKLLKKDQAERINKQPHSFFAIALAYNCALYYTFATQHLLQDKRYSNAVKNDLAREFITGLEEGSNLYFQNSQSDANKLHQLFIQTFNQGKAFSAGYPDIHHITNTFLDSVIKEYSLDIDDATSIGFLATLNPIDEISTMSKFFQTALTGR